MPGHDTKVELRGFTDTLILFDGGGFGITDFKTAEPKEEHISFYGRQLMSYVMAAEHPAPGKPRLCPVTHLGLVCFEPVEMVAVDSRYAFATVPSWVEVPRDDDAFLAFLSEVLDVITAGEAPKHEGCPWCEYRYAA